MMAKVRGKLAQRKAAGAYGSAQQSAAYTRFDQSEIDASPTSLQLFNVERLLNLFQRVRSKVLQPLLFACSASSCVWPWLRMLAEGAQAKQTQTKCGNIVYAPTRAPTAIHQQRQCLANKSCTLTAPSSVPRYARFTLQSPPATHSSPAYASLSPRTHPTPSIPKRWPIHSSF
jgi:hypothetical protein